jgi:AcrR family transcriptional regulator
MPRVTRAQRGARNRERVLAAARAAFGRKGFHGASLDEIAEEAGFSKGVVYSQFGSKDDLFLTLLERRIEERAVENLEAIRRAPAGAELATIWELAHRAQRQDPAWTLVALEFRIHAARDPALNRRYAALHANTIAGITRTLGVLCETRGISPPHPPEELARFILALDSGYALEDLVAPPDAGREAGGAAFAALLGVPFDRSPPTTKEDSA